MITLAGLVRRAGINLRAYLGGLISVNLLPTIFLHAGIPAKSALAKLISYLVIAVTILGGYWLRRKTILVNLYLLGYVGMYLAWPEVWRSERFMVPITPVVAVYFMGGLSRIIRFFGVRKSVTAAVCLALALTNMQAVSQYVRRYKGYPPGWHSYLETARWARENTGEDAVVLCRKPFLFHIFSDRRTISYPFTRDVDAMQDYLMKARPDYMVIDNFGSGSTQRFLVPALENMRGMIQVVHSTAKPVNVVLRFSPEQGEESR
jgi:hypothetical protein